MSAECVSQRLVAVTGSLRSPRPRNLRETSAPNVTAGLWESWSGPPPRPQHFRTPFPEEPRDSDFRRRYGSAHAAASRLTLRSYG